MLPIFVGQVLPTKALGLIAVDFIEHLVLIFVGAGVIDGVLFVCALREAACQNCASQRMNRGRIRQAAFSCHTQVSEALCFLKLLYNCFIVLHLLHL